MSTPTSPAARTTRRAIQRALLGAALCLLATARSAPAHAGQPTPSPVWKLAAGGGGLATLTDAEVAPGGALSLERVLWASPRWGGWFQLDWRAVGLVGGSGFGAHLVAGTSFGFTAGWWRAVTISAQTGVAGLGAVGVRDGGAAGVGVGLYGSGGWNLHVFGDPARFLTLGLVMTAGAPLASTGDPYQSDCPTCAGMTLLGTIGYTGRF